MCWSLTLNKSVKISLISAHKNWSSLIPIEINLNQLAFHLKKLISAYCWAVSENQLAHYLLGLIYSLFLQISKWGFSWCLQPSSNITTHNQWLWHVSSPSTRCITNTYCQRLLSTVFGYHCTFSSLTQCFHQIAPILTVNIYHWALQHV